MKRIISYILSALIVLTIMLGTGTSPVMAATPFIKCYTITTGNTVVYNSTSTSSGRRGTIFGSDEIKITEAYSNGFLKVEYPTAKGTKSGYILKSDVVTSTSGTTKYATAKITTYRRNSTSSTYGSIYKNDSVMVLGSRGSFTQVRYPISGGFKFAWIKTTDANNYLKKAGQSSSSQSTSSKVLVSQAEIDKAAKNNGIGTSTNAYKALLSINSKYYSKLSANKSGTLVFLFEGVGNNSSANKRMNAMCVVVKNGKIVYLNRNSSTIPDYPFNPSKNGGTAMPTIKSGIYGFTTKNHQNKYAALNITNASVVRFRSKSNYYQGSSSAINVHRRSSDSISAVGNSWVNSAGCQLIGKSGTGSSSEYAKFIQAVGIVPSGSAGNAKYKTSVSGKIVIDRTYAYSYLSSIGYSGSAIKAIG